MNESFQVLRVGEETLPLPPTWTVDEAGCAEEALVRLANSSYDVALIAAPSGDGDTRLEDLLEQCAALRTTIPLVAYDPTARAGDAARYVRLGAYDVAGAGDDVVAKLITAAEFRTVPVSRESEPWRAMLVGSSPALRRTTDVIRLVAARRSTVLVTGETGTGKEMVARALHMASPRGHLPMITVNAAALPETLLEAELFGHVKGAFTGAVNQRVGRFEQANRSTLFLDEIGDLPLDIQTKLLRFLQEREFQRVGSSETIRVDVRLVAATNVDLLARTREGRFREDLYYRLNVVPITTPPLRERLDDVPLLAQHFIGKICGQEGIPLRRLSPEALLKLRHYAWPGNVRQLENAVEMAVALSGERELLGPADFDLRGGRPTAAAVPVSGLAVPDAGLDYEMTIGAIERRILDEALRKTGGNKTAAAQMLGLKRTTLAAKLRSLEAAAS